MERWLTSAVMPRVAFPRVNRAGPRACQSPPGSPERTRAGGRSSGWGAARPPVVRVCSRAAGRADSVGVCCLSSRARGGAVRTGARSATTPARDPSGLTGACADVTSPVPGTCPVRSPPPARSRNGFVRQPCPCAPCGGRQEGRCRAAHQSRTFHERSTSRALSRHRKGTGPPNGTPGKENVARW